MTPDQAARLAAHGRRLLTVKILTPHDYAVLDAMLWRLRRPGRWDMTAPYKTIARLAGVGREKAIDAVRKLQMIGLISKEKRRVLVQWGYNKAQIAKRQIENKYVFHIPSTESPRKPTSIGFDRLISRAEKAFPEKSMLDAVLDRLRVGQAP